VTFYIETRPPLVATHERPSAADVAAATDLRHRASTALAERHPAECLALLDLARAKDPDGDATADVARMRAEAQRALLGGDA
jgi:hypothetical protein